MTNPLMTGSIPLLLALAQIVFAGADGHEKMVRLISDAEFMQVDDNHYLQSFRRRCG